MNPSSPGTFVVTLVVSPMGHITCGCDTSNKYTLTRPHLKEASCGITSYLLTRLRFFPAGQKNNHMFDVSVRSSLFMPVMDSASGLEQLHTVITSLWMDESVYAQSGKDRHLFSV